ncbi:MAG: ABC transporter permease [candidate division NC10 bacterium]|nr:ABC transporter permease [candidate division NC10 bacterium]
MGHLPVVTIRPSRGWVSLNLRDLWEYRELLYFLIWRDVKVRYKQTALGAAWAILQPFLTMVIFTVFFGRLAKVPSDGIPYPVFAYTALLPWQLFAHALSESGNSLVANQQLIKKIYFPRLVIPISAVLAGLVDFGIAFIVLLAMMFYYGVTPTVAALSLPLFLLLAIATALAAGLWLSALNVQYRDVRYTIPFLTQVWLVGTPIAYSSSLVPERWRGLYGLNPMAGVVEGFRWALLGKGGVGPLILASALVVVVLLVGGLVYFRRMEKSFADVV